MQAGAWDFDGLLTWHRHSILGSILVLTIPVAGNYHPLPLLLLSATSRLINLRYPYCKEVLILPWSSTARNKDAVFDITWTPVSKFQGNVEACHPVLMLLY